MLIGVIAASAPPVIMMSASPRWMVRKASPMALAALAQAVATAVLGPRKPYVIDNVPLAALTIIFGTRNAETRSGPLFSSLASCSSISCKPPIPEPMITPQRNKSSLEKSSPLWRTASMPATSANWVKRSIRRISLAEAYSSPGAQSRISPPNLTLNFSVSNSVNE